MPVNWLIFKNSLLFKNKIVLNIYQIHEDPYVCKFLYWLQLFYSTLVYVLQLISNGKRLKRQFFPFVSYFIFSSFVETSVAHVLCCLLDL